MLLAAYLKVEANDQRYECYPKTACDPPVHGVFFVGTAGMGHQPTTQSGFHLSAIGSYSPSFAATSARIGLSWGAVSGDSHCGSPTARIPLRQICAVQPKHCV